MTPADPGMTPAARGRAGSVRPEAGNGATWRSRDRGRPASVRLTDSSARLMPEGLRPCTRSGIGSEAELRTAGEAR